VSRTIPGVLIALVLFIAAGCDGESGAGRKTPEGRPESRPAGDGTTPESNAIVAREGDHLLVIVDVATRDGKGREVEQVTASTGGATSRATLANDRFTLELRLPAGTNEVKLDGRSAGGASWSIPISTKLDR
jgi:hypothetical protein